MKPVIIALVGSLSQATVTRLEDEGYEVVQEKMSGAVRVENKSLRDYFAAAALTGILAYPGNEQSGSAHTNSTTEQIAGLCYAYADAMLAEREKNRKKGE